jgi:23S rRNA pseudouridine1911/1915/1917 synthase
LKTGSTQPPGSKRKKDGTPRVKRPPEATGQGAGACLAKVYARNDRPEQRIRVLYEDNHLLAVYKPAGILAQGDRTGDPSLLDWARAWVKDRYCKPGNVYLGLVHRLDRPVSGVMLFARTSKAASRLSEQFREHRVRKIYLAVIPGEIKPRSGILNVRLSRTGTRTRVTTSRDPLAKEAELRYRTMDAQQGLSLLEIDLISGRHHQIRVQLAAVGHPICGDRKYSLRQVRRETSIALMARTLTVRHPTRPMDITFVSPIPDNWPWPPTSEEPDAFTVPRCG